MKRGLLLVFLLIFDFALLLANNWLKSAVQPVAIIVPHHDIVQEKRLEFFKLIAQKRPKTESIIILSPDHFSPDQFRISYADITWQLSNGTLEFDRQLGPKVTDSLAKENGLVTSDHGIYNLLPDIKDVWPQAKIVPLLIGQGLKFSNLDDLVSKIDKYCREKCLLIASVDFSHYLPRALADIHDIKSLGALENLKLNSVKDVEVDSSQSLYALLNYALLRQAKNWHFFYHSNSGEIQDSRDAETTSHFFGWYQRDFFSHPKNPVLTFTVGMNVSNEKDEKSLGERFFYGVDYFNGQLKESYKPSAKIIIEPSSSGSKIEFDHNLLKISLGEDLVVSGYTSFGETRLVFLPLTKVDSTNYLMRGEAKTEFFKNFFKDLDVTVFPKLDMNEGIIVL